MAHSGKTMTFATNLVPQENNIYSLGTDSLKWIIRGSFPLSDVTGADDLKAIEAISGTTGLLKKTAANTWTLDTTSYATKTEVNGLLAAADAMIFKGTLGTGGTITAVPDGTSGKTYQAGYTYKVITAGKYANIQCEVGDLLIAISDSTSGQTAVNNAHWTVAQTNIDGAVTGPSSANTNRIARFNDDTGKIIKNSSVSIDDNGNITFPSGANASVFPAHYYTNAYDSNGNTYVHYYSTGLSSTYSYANLRVKNDTSFKVLRFGGDGTFTWDGKTVLTNGNTTAPSSIPTLSWGAESTVFTLNGTAVKVKAMSKPTAADVGALASSTVVTNVAISADTTTNKEYALVFGTTPSDGTSPTAAKTEGLQKNITKFYTNPSTGILYSTKFCVDEHVILQWNSTDNSLDFVFA